MSKILAVACLGLLGMSSAAHAVAGLQLYIEGSSYDFDSQTWVAGGSNFRLWVIGNVDGPGSHGSILDVQLTAAFKSGEIGTISINPTTTSLLTDPSTPVAPIQNLSVGADGTLPLMSDGSYLPAHGIYGAGTSFKQWALGDFSSLDSPVADFISSYPSTFSSGAGQINAYDVSITGYSFVHFDSFNHIEGATHALFAPFSHDSAVTPEPGSLVLLGLGLVGGAFIRRRRTQR